MSHSATLSYTINSNDTIVSTGGSWDEFAEENGLPSQVIGDSLWEYIEGHQVIHIYELLLSRVRNDGVTCEFPFRCDAPEVEREM